MNSKEKADLAQVQSESITGYYNAGLLGRQTSLREIKTTSQETGLGTNVTDEMIESADDEVQVPLEIEQEEARAGTEEFGEGKGGVKADAAKDSWWNRVFGAKDAEFVESDHPRDDDGKFGSGGGGYSASGSLSEKTRIPESVERDFPDIGKPIPYSTEPIPEEGQYPAVETDDGQIFVDKRKLHTHVEFIRSMKIPPDRVASGGFISNGVYEASERSDSGRYGERARANVRLLQKKKR
jgi:hypothetical protein